MLIARTPLWEDRCFTQTRDVQVVEIKNSRSIGFPKGREYDHVLPPFFTNGSHRLPHEVSFLCSNDTPAR